MHVSEILAIKGAVLYTIAPEKTLGEVVSVMTDMDVGSLVCFTGGRMVGMLTFREVLQAVNDNGANWGSVRVADVMVHDPVVVSPAMDVDELRHKMVTEHQRYLPVMENSTLLGVISFHDVAKAVLEEQGFENRMLKAYIRDWPEEQKSLS